MSSEAKTKANRANAQKSTGPRTVEGKEKSKHNAVRHGLTGKQLIAPGEDPAAYEALLEDLMQTYRPANAIESALVEEIAQSFWRLQRARRIETESFNFLTGGADPVITFTCHEKEFDNLRRYMASIERAWHRAMEALAAMQKARRKQEQESGGFVSQTAENHAKPPARVIPFPATPPQTVTPDQPESEAPVPPLRTQ